jgi:hypothetical protein
LLLAALAVSTACAACDSGGSGPETPKWGRGNGPDFCQAGRESKDGSLWITLRLPAAASAISVHGPAFKSVEPDRPQPAYALLIDGRAMRAEARGAPAGKDSGLDFLFNPRPLLLRREADGFDAAVTKDGREVYRVRVDGTEAREAIAGTLACDRELRFSGRIDPYKR